MRLGRTVSDISKISVAVTLTVESNTCKDVKIAVGSVAPSVIRARKSEAILEGQKLEQKIIETAAEIAVGEVKPITDIRSTAEYREEMTKVLVKRAIEKALERVKA
jgi:carbon-monoxide dehydrogenase medium subunit